jgi:hypothetical protein
MTSEELASTGVPPTGENAPSSTNDPAAEAIRDSGSREDGEIRSENRSGGDEDLSNVEVDLSELVAARLNLIHQHLLSASLKLRPKLIKSMRRPDFSLLVMDVLLLMKRSLLLKPTKLLFSGTFSPVDLDFLVTLICLPFWRSFP